MFWKVMVANCWMEAWSLEILQLPMRSLNQLKAMVSAEQTSPTALFRQSVLLRYEGSADIRKAAFSVLFRSDAEKFVGLHNYKDILTTSSDHVRIENVSAQTIGRDTASPWSFTEVCAQLAWSLFGQQQQGSDRDVRANDKQRLGEQRVDLSVLRPILSNLEVDSISAALPKDFDLDRADVEMVPKRWIVIERSGSVVNGREGLANLMRPILKERILPWVRSRLECPDCVVCSSIVRRYSHALGERHRDPPHTDGQAYATVVIALNSAGSDYSGGLYVITDPAKPLFLSLQAGDAVLHRWDLQHGVQVNSGSRISWILWIQDASPCVAQEQLHKRPYFLKAAEAGNVVARYLLGIGANGRTEEGKKWLQMAAEAGFVKAAAQLGISLQGSDDTVSRKWLTVAAKQGDAGAQLQLATTMLRAGKLGKSEGWFRKAAVGGHATAQNELGMALLTGAFHREPDPKEAVRWLSAAARQGHALAQTNLGVCYAEGRGTSKSLPAAAYWWQEAATQGMPDALANLERMRKEHPNWGSWPVYVGD